MAYKIVSTFAEIHKTKVYCCSYR